LKPDGTVRWTFLTGEPITSSPAVNSDGTVYFTSTDGNLYALKSDGTERWRLRTGGMTESSPVLDGGGNIYLSVNQAAYSVSSEGKARWWHFSAILVDETPAVAADGAVYFSMPWRQLWAAKADGTELWSDEMPTELYASPTVATNGIIYVGTGQFINAVSPTNHLAPTAKSSWPMFRANPQHTGRVLLNR